MLIYMNETLRHLNSNGIDPSIEGMQIRQEEQYVVLIELKKEKNDRNIN